jgi:superfamily II DNA or RNA helicase
MIEFGALTIKKSDFSKAKIKAAKKALTVIGTFGKEEKAYKEDPTNLYIPRYWHRRELFGFSALSSFPYPCSEGRNIDLEFKHSLRHYQFDPVEKVLTNLNDSGATVLAADCGLGKTVMSLKVLSEIGKSTLVLVHTELLLRQWKERIDFFLPDASVGYIHGKYNDCGDDYDIVIGMIPTIKHRDITRSFSDSFGFIIADECHRLAAPEWNKSIWKFSSKYRLGLSATPNRDDEMEDLFLYHLGKVCCEIKNKLVLPTIYKVETCVRIPVKEYTGTFNDVPAPCFPLLYNLLSEVEDRTNKVISLSVRALNKGRNVLVLCNRREHAELIGASINKKTSPSTAVVFLGGMRKKMDVINEFQCIVSTWQMFAEAIDIDVLDTLIMAAPRKNAKQGVGRLLRKYQYKQKVVVIDLVDIYVYPLVKLWLNREKLYKSYDYEIID